MPTSNNFYDSDRIDETSLTLLDRTQAYLHNRLREQVPNTLLVEAWAEFYRLYSRLIRRYVMHRNVPPSEVEDCIQEIWMAIAQNLALFKHPRNRPGLRAWLYSVVRNKTTDVMRRRLRRSAASLETIESDGLAVLDRETSNVWERLLMQTILAEVLDDESETNRLILRRRLLEGVRSAEVAAELGVTTKVVRYRLGRILNRLQVRWAFYTGQPLGTASIAGSPPPSDDAAPGADGADSQDDADGEDAGDLDGHAPRA